MKSAKSAEPPMPVASWENPLIPNKRLRQLYTAMAELRLLEEHLGNLPRRKPTFQLHRGEEACLASTVLSLTPADRTSESSPGIAIKFLRGSKLVELLNLDPSISSKDLIDLPVVEDTSARLHMAVGAAFALGSNKKKSVAVAYIHAGDLDFKQWRPVLKLAGSHAAPILFVVLPHSEKSFNPGKLSLKATTCGVPGIPVDAADPIALYRVAQESMLRIRAGGGPVLMECIPFQLPEKKAEDTDPILRMQQLLLPRGIASEDWFKDVADRFTERLNNADN